MAQHTIPARPQFTLAAQERFLRYVYVALFRTFNHAPGSRTAAEWWERIEP